MPPRFPTWLVHALLAVLLCLAACGPAAAVGVSPAVTTPPAPTATPMSAPLLARPLTWQPVTMPAPIGPDVFAADGESAYTCAVGSDPQGNGTLSIWRTADHGVDWIPARVVPTNPTINGCVLVVDVSDPSVAALAWQPRGGGAGDSYTNWMTTVDGGVTWQAMPPEPSTPIDQLDSRGGVIYALRETGDSSVEFDLWASADRMGSWQQVDHGLPTYISGFWLQPDGAGILTVQSGDPDASPSLWTSPDDGATWHQLDVPGGVPAYWTARFAPLGMPSNGLVARSLQGQFHICVDNGPATDSTQLGLLAAVTCSTNGGTSWQVYAMPPLTTSQGSSGATSLLAITNDGSLLATVQGTLYRLDANTGRWQSLGPLPEPGVVYCPAPGNGILWAAPLPSGSGDLQRRIFTASYTL